MNLLNRALSISKIIITIDDKKSDVNVKLDGRVTPTQALAAMNVVEKQLIIRLLKAEKEKEKKDSEDIGKEIKKSILTSNKKIILPR